MNALIDFYPADVRRARVENQAVVGVSEATQQHRRRTSRILADEVGRLLGDAAGSDAPARRRAAFAYTGGISARFIDLAVGVGVHA